MLEREIRVFFRDYKETTDPSEYLTTIDLTSCVGVALVRDFKDFRKRGLTHISYDPTDCYDETGICRLSERARERANKILEKVVSQFMELETFPEKLDRPEEIQAYIITNRKEEERVKGRDKTIKSRGYDNIGKSNPMFDFVLKWFYEKGINLALSDSVSKWKREADKSDRKLYPIHTKIISLHQNNINILYARNTGGLLNSKTYSHPL